MAEEPATQPTPTPKRRAPKNWKAIFLKAFADTSNVRLSCFAAGVDRSYAYKTKEKDPKFAEAWARAEEDATDLLEAEARKRARENSDTLLIFLLKAHRREKYGDQVTVTHLLKVLRDVAERPSDDLLKLLGYERADEGTPVEPT